AIGLAGMLTCSMVHIQIHVPLHRRTEVIGSLGTSGFVGMVLGTQGGDWIFSSMATGRPQFLALFGTAASMAVFYLIIVLILTRNDQHDRPRDTPAAHRLLFRYWPGPVMFVAIMLGVGFTVTTVFLTRFATAEGLGGIGTFFTGYSVSAFVFRLASRRWSRTYGRHLMIVVGLVGQACGLLSLPHVAANWQFLIPAFGCGLGHALLFPAVVSLGAGAFPQELRG
ncbi:MAG: MFS transporter, partial [Planctomycetaceae bacterium]|nr:MFS transporter [Planctomycetaceae bacterium]